MDTVSVAGANGAQASGQAHVGWPRRRAVAAWFGGYAVATMLFLVCKGWVLPLAAAIGGALVAPLLWLVTQVPATAEVLVIGRAATHLLKFGTPYLPAAQLSGWKSYNPYL